MQTKYKILAFVVLACSVVAICIIMFFGNRLDSSAKLTDQPAPVLVALPSPAHTQLLKTVSQPNNIVVVAVLTNDDLRCMPPGFTRVVVQYKNQSITNPVDKSYVDMAMAKVESLGLDPKHVQIEVVGADVSADDVKRSADEWNLQTKDGCITLGPIKVASPSTK